MKSNQHLSDVGDAALSSIQDWWENGGEDDDIPTTQGVYDPLKEDY